jgi:hypothetical protein
MLSHQRVLGVPGVGAGVGVGPQQLDVCACLWMSAQHLVRWL